MIDLVKKTLLTGIGVAALTKEKVEELAKDFIEKGKLTEQEGRELVDQLLKRSEEAKDELQAQVEEKVKLVMEKMNLAPRSDVDELKLEITVLREKLQEYASSQD